MTYPETIKELAIYTGRILLALFVSWLSENPEVDQRRAGFLFENNISSSISYLFSIDENYKKIGLDRMVDFRMLIKAFFYSSSEGRIWYSKDLGGKHTFLELWDLFDDVLQLTQECNSGNQSLLCSVHSTLLNDQGRTDRIQDFRISEKLFLAQFYTKWPMIGRNVYKTDKQIDGFTKNNHPWRTFNYPTIPQFYRFKVDKNLSIEELGLPNYGLWRYDYRNVSYERPFFTLVTEDLTHVRTPYVINQDVNNIKYEEGFVIWAGVPLLEEGWHSLVNLDNEQGNRMADFYPYTPQCFNVTNNITYKGKDYEVGDRYYRVEEERKLGGYAEGYKKMWFFGERGYGIVNNITSFLSCLNRSSYSDCLDYYLSWYKGCDKNENGYLCDLIQSLLKRISPSHTKERLSLFISIFVGCFFTVLVVSLNYYFSLRNIKFKEETNLEIYDKV